MLNNIATRLTPADDDLRRKKGPRARKRDPAEPRSEAFVKDVDALVKNNSVLNVFFKDDNKEFI